MPPLLERGGVERSETEGIRSKSAKRASLVMLFLPIRNAEHEQERKGTLSRGDKEGGKTAI